MPRRQTILSIVRTVVYGCLTVVLAFLSVSGIKVFCLSVVFVEQELEDDD